MSLPFQNEYNLRTVAEALSKPCLVCHKNAVKVLITSDDKDFFYVCPSHLEDRGFASPVIDPKLEAEKKEAELREQEKEAIIKEYQEKIKKKAGKKDDKSKDDAKHLEREKDEKLKAIDGKSASTPAVDGPRKFNLHRNFYQMRLDRRQNLERAKKEQQRMKDPSFFPTVPKGNLD